MTGVCLVLCTVSRGSEDALVERILEAGLAACVNLVGPVRSRYRWKGAIETSEECLLLIKTAAERVAELRDRLVEWHEYEVPEVLVFDADSGFDRYLAWVRDES